MARVLEAAARRRNRRAAAANSALREGVSLGFLPAALLGGLGSPIGATVGSLIVAFSEIGMTFASNRRRRWADVRLQGRSEP
jgi:branched-subunit amino acid ABC-type transport system permease component